MVEVYILCISSIQPGESSTPESRGRSRVGDSRAAELADTVMVPSTETHTRGRTYDAGLVAGSSDTPVPARIPSAGQETEIYGMSFVRQSLADQGLSSQAIDIIFDSWRSSTKKQYLSYIHKWILFCQKNNFDLVTTEATYVVEFLTELYSKGLTINTARSALSTFLGVASSTHIGSQALVTRFMKGVARNRPTLPRYKNIWDVNLVLNVFRQQPLVEYLSLDDLTLRTVTLLALVSAQRCQSLHLLDLDCMTVLEDRYEFLLSGNFKQSRAGCETLLVSLPAFREDIRLCIFHTLTVYLT